MNEKIFIEQLKALDLDDHDFTSLAYGSTYIGVFDNGSIFCDVRTWDDEIGPKNRIYGGAPGYWDDEIRELGVDLGLEPEDEDFEMTEDFISGLADMVREHIQDIDSDLIECIDNFMKEAA